MATIAELEQDLSDYRARRKEVALGGAHVDVWVDGERIKVFVPDLDALNRLIQLTEAEIYQAKLDAGQSPRPRRTAIGVGY